MSHDIKNKILNARFLFDDALKSSKNKEEIDAVKKQFLGKDGICIQLTTDLKNAPLEEKKNGRKRITKSQRIYKKFTRST